MESRRLFFVAQMFSPFFFSADRFRFVIFVSFPQTMAMCKYKLGDAEWSGDLRILKGGICSRGADPHLRSMGFLWSLKTSVRVPGNPTVPIYPPRTSWTTPLPAYGMMSLSTLHMIQSKVVATENWALSTKMGSNLQKTSCGHPKNASCVQKNLY